MPYLETVQELLDDGAALGTNLEPTCNLTHKVGIQVVGGTGI